MSLGGTRIACIAGGANLRVTTVRRLMSDLMEA